MFTNDVDRVVDNHMSALDEAGADWDQTSAVAFGATGPPEVLFIIISYYNYFIVIIVIIIILIITLINAFKKHKIRLSCSISEIFS